MISHLAVIREGVFHVEVRETGFFGHPARGQKVFDAVPRNGCDFDMALADQPLEVQIGQTECDVEFSCQRALRDSSVPLNCIEELQVALSLNIHGHPEPSRQTFTI